MIKLTTSVGEFLVKTSFADFVAKYEQAKKRTILERILRKNKYLLIRVLDSEGKESTVWLNVRFTEIISIKTFSIPKAEETITDKILKDPKNKRLVEVLAREITKDVKDTQKRALRNIITDSIKKKYKDSEALQLALLKEAASEEIDKEFKDQEISQLKEEVEKEIKELAEIQKQEKTKKCYMRKRK